MQESRRNDPEAPQTEQLTVVLEHVRQALRGLRYGNVSLIVQDGRVVQVDRFEKIRVVESPAS